MLIPTKLVCWQKLPDNDMGRGWALRDKFLNKLNYLKYYTYYMYYKGSFFKIHILKKILRSKDFLVSLEILFQTNFGLKEILD